MSSQSINTNLVFIGGGHSHVIALKLWGNNPLKGVKVTLISDTIYTPYSGMLPGYVAGFYNYNETHINLQKLANFAQIELCLDRAIKLDLNQNQVICENHPPLSFDYLSLDIGSIPATVNVAGAFKYTIPAKPVPQFLTAWNNLLQKVKNNPNLPIIITIVGGGAGGVELALNMQSHLQKFTDKLTINLFHSGTSLLSGHNPSASQIVENMLINRKVNLYLKEKVEEITINQEQLNKNQNSANLLKKTLNDLSLSLNTEEYQIYQIKCESGLNIITNFIFWVTQASAPAWIKNSGLTTDSQGFILVKDTLQSVSHPHIFAAGDIATMKNYVRPKAGVFAVRQGKPLGENLQRIILKKPLKNYVPQKRYLSLIGTGDKSAIASWDGIGLHSPLLWYWKDYIDRQFMRVFSEL